VPDQEAYITAGAAPPSPGASAPVPPGASAPVARLDKGETSPQIFKPSPGISSVLRRRGLRRPGRQDERAKKRGYHAELVRQFLSMETGEHGGLAQSLALKWLPEIEKCPGVVRWHEPCGKNSFIGDKCSFLLCPWCQARRSRRLVKRLGPLVAAMVAPKLWTFSPPNLAELSSEAVSDMGKALTEMHRLVYFKKRVRGGLRAIEVTNRGRGWNLHSHEAVDSDWVAQYPMWDVKRAGSGWKVVEKHPGLAREYTRICQRYPTLMLLGRCLAGRGHASGTGGLDLDCPDCWYFVDVRVAGVNVVNEIAKYVTKGSQVVSAGPRAIVDFMLAFKGKRGIQPFGNLYNVDLDSDDEVAPVRLGECPYDDCPNPGEASWKYVHRGFPTDLALERNPETGTCRLVAVPGGS